MAMSAAFSQDAADGPPSGPGALNSRASTLLQRLLSTAIRLNAAKRTERDVLSSTIILLALRHLEIGTERASDAREELELRRTHAASEHLNSLKDHLDKLWAEIADPTQRESKDV